MWRDPGSSGTAYHASLSSRAGRSAKEVANMAQKAIIRYFPVFEKVGDSEACEEQHPLDHKTPLFCSGRVKAEALLDQPPGFQRADSCISTKPACPGASPTLPESSMLSGKDAGSPLCAVISTHFARDTPCTGHAQERQKPAPSSLL